MIIVVIIAYTKNLPCFHTEETIILYAGLFLLDVQELIPAEIWV